jgi:hypothetical protein
MSPQDLRWTNVEEMNFYRIRISLLLAESIIPPRRHFVARFEWDDRSVRWKTGQDTGPIERVFARS